MKNRIPVVSLVFVLLAQAAPIFAEDPENTAGLDLYSKALELLLSGDRQAALPLLHEFIETYPESPYRAKAESYLQRYEHLLDRSGIVSFYLGSMGTGVLTAVTIPTVFDINDEVALGTAGLLGLGFGFGSAWLMSRNIDMSLGQDLWIETIETMSIMNFLSAYSMIRPDLNNLDFAEQELWDKINLAGLTTSAIAGRAAAYVAVRDRLPSPGRASFVTTSFLWSEVYLEMVLSGILESNDRILNSALGIVVPDVLTAGSWFLWDSLHWSVQRTGLVSVGGIGGALVGWFATVIAGGMIPDLSGRVAVGTILGFSIAGQFAAARLTTGFDDERMTPSMTKARPAFSVVPVVGGNGFGIAGRIGL